MWVGWSLVCVCVWICVYGKRNTAWAINTKLDRRSVWQAVCMHWSWFEKVKVTGLSGALQVDTTAWVVVIKCCLCVCVFRVIRENSAGSEMSKLLSFGYLGNTPQSNVVGGTAGYQPPSAGTQAIRGNDVRMSEYQPNRQPTVGALSSGKTLPAGAPWVYPGLYRFSASYSCGDMTLQI